MALTDQQFNSYIRFVLSALQDILQEQDQKRKAGRVKDLMDNLQAAIADTAPGTRMGSRTVTETVTEAAKGTAKETGKRGSAKKQQAPAPDDMTDAFQDWLKDNHTKRLSTGGKSALLDYGYRVDKVRERENLTWTDLAANIRDIVKKYDTGGDEMAFGLKNNGANIIALKAFETWVSESNGGGEAPIEEAEVNADTETPTQE